MQISLISDKISMPDLDITKGIYLSLTLWGVEGMSNSLQLGGRCTKYFYKGGFELTHLPRFGRHWRSAVNVKYERRRIKFKHFNNPNYKLAAILKQFNFHGFVQCRLK